MGFGFDVILCVIYNFRPLVVNSKVEDDFYKCPLF